MPFTWWEPEHLLSEAGMTLSTRLEDALLTVSRTKDVDPTDTALVEACRELAALGYVEVSELNDSQNGEDRLYAFAVLRFTPEGDEELAAIKARRGIS